MEKRRVVITGLGAVTPLGLTAEETWANLLQGKSGIGPITQFDVSDMPSQIAGCVKDFNPDDYMDRKDARRIGRFTQFSIAASRMAIQDAALDLSREDLTRVGLEIATALGGVDLIESQSRVLQQEGSRRLNPTLAPSVLVNTAACQVAVSLGTQGPTNSPAAACASGVYALGYALRHLQRGDADVMLAGGTESAMTPIAVAAFGRLGALSKRNDEPTRACRPFDADRDGTVIAEGAAVVVMETLEHALQRGARILAEVVGFGLSEDAYHLVAPDPTGKGAARAIRLSLADAGMSPAAIDYIAAHGTATPLNDVTETLAVKEVLGEKAYKTPISSNKSMLGHMLGAAGAISAVVAILAMRDQQIPPTMNLEKPDPQCDLDYVPLQSRPCSVQTTLTNAFGFGGQNAALVTRRYP
jgi:3-oxoacyl-[acyl-carrier-protein] synthase II